VRCAHGLVTAAEKSRRTFLKVDATSSFVSEHDRNGNCTATSALFECGRKPAERETRERNNVPFKRHWTWPAYGAFALRAIPYARKQRALDSRSSRLACNPVNPGNRSRSRTYLLWRRHSAFRRATAAQLVNVAAPTRPSGAAAVIFVRAYVRFRRFDRPARTASSFSVVVETV